MRADNISTGGSAATGNESGLSQVAASPGRGTQVGGMRPSQSRPIGANESQFLPGCFDIFSDLSEREEQELEGLKQREQLRAVQAKRKELERLRRMETDQYVPTSSPASSKKSTPGATPRQSRHARPVGKKHGGLDSGGLIETPGPLKGIGGLKKEDEESKRRAKSLEDRLRTRSGQMRGTWTPTASGRPSVESSPRSAKSEASVDDKDVRKMVAKAKKIAEGGQERVQRHPSHLRQWKKR